MARIPSRGNQATELALAKLLRAHGITGWRRQIQICCRARSPLRAGGKISKAGAHGVSRPAFRVRPDFIFPKFRLAVFVDGCFWHGCPRHATTPKNNRRFWQKKLSANKRRDALVTRTLRRNGWRVVRLWECAVQQAIKQPGNAARLWQRLQRPLGA